ncbi:hypothetical protein [Alicyclobacillus sendaiensis]|uniref:hypothetical protein n=1 Tax=Alicyclobacillus sendaiensis TaxID=192387 RepID=UPI000784D96B|nr:hypothetical protein [Alicyclobacillus sendaiensis]
MRTRWNDSGASSPRLKPGLPAPEIWWWPLCQEIVIRLVPSGDLVTLLDDAEESVTKRAEDWVREQAEVPCVIGVGEQ